MRYAISKPAVSEKLVRLHNALAWLGSRLIGCLLITIVAIQLHAIVARYLPALETGWTGDAISLLMLATGWIGACHLWLIRGHLVLDLIPITSPEIRRAIDRIANSLMLLASLAILPAVATTLTTYHGLMLPNTHLPASLKFVPMFVGVCLLATGSALNLSRSLVERGEIPS